MLVVVLVIALLLGLAALSLAFTVTLDSLAARHAQQAALVEGEAEGGLAVGVRALYAAPDPKSAVTQALARLRNHGWSVHGKLAPVTVDVLRLTVTASVGRTVVVRSADVVTDPAVVRLLARD